MDAAAAAAGAAAEERPRPVHQPDWIPHELAVAGDPARLAAFRAAAAGPGVVPWEDDLAAEEERWFHRMLAQPPEVRRWGAADLRVLARLLRERLEAARGRRAAAPPGEPRRVPLDLHRLVPVPAGVLRLGPADPAACSWLRGHWGPPGPLRAVVEVHGAPRRGQVARRAPGRLLRLRFVAEDWSPWPALRAAEAAWPGLAFRMRVVEDEGDGGAGAARGGTG